MILKSTEGHNSCVAVEKLKDGTTYVRFYTTYDKARHPEWQANEMKLFLDDQGVKNLISALNDPA